MSILTTSELYEKLKLSDIGISSPIQYITSYHMKRYMKLVLILQMKEMKKQSLLPLVQFLWIQVFTGRSAR